MQRRDFMQFSLALLGAGAASSLTRALQAGVTADTALTNPVFTAGQRKTVSLLTEMVIPTTDTPGAIAAGVPRFVEIMVGEWYTPTERNIFFEGLEELDAKCANTTGKRFLDASETERTSALLAMEEMAMPIEVTPEGATKSASPSYNEEQSPFFTKLKDLTVLGYYTSEIGAKQELVYNPAPGRFEGDYDFAEVGRQWSY